MVSITPAVSVIVGFARPVTSEVKHVSFGLTSKHFDSGPFYCLK